jgi:hypothetical protein
MLNRVQGFRVPLSLSGVDDQNHVDLGLEPHQLAVGMNRSGFIGEWSVPISGSCILLPILLPGSENRSPGRRSNREGVRDSEG